MSRANGVNVNLFVVHSQIVPLECLRRGIRGIKSTRPRASLFGFTWRRGEKAV
ncbi:MAG: phosphosulfolactate synthase [Mycobacterium sp.]